MPRILLLEPYTRVKHVAKLRDMFFANGWQVQKISPDQKAYSEDSILIVPDTGGINSNVSYCGMEDLILPFNCPPQDQGVEYFRLNTLHYYINKKIPILGIGYSSYLIFAEVLGGKLFQGPDGISRAVLPKIVDDEQGFLSSIPKKVCAGFDQQYSKEVPFAEDLIILADKLLKLREGDGSNLVPVPVPKDNLPGSHKL